MRELTMDEVAVVSGGEIGEIVVTGSLFQGGGGTIWAGTGSGSGGFLLFDQGAGDTGNWDIDGDGVANFQDEDPYDPQNNTMVVTASYNPVAGAVGDFVHSQWGNFLGALAAKYGANSPFLSTFGAGTVGDLTADAARTAAYLIVEHLANQGASEVRFAREYGNPDFHIP